MSILSDNHVLQIPLVNTGGKHVGVISSKYGHNFLGHLYIPREIATDHIEIRIQFLRNVFCVQWTSLVNGYE